ncbi:MAG: T9SS type A sorting domain-containing protein [Rhodothermales bacterium]|nr:T9SS type A sorting domain-containing protein [Rhodothermales bacterium]
MFDLLGRRVADGRSASGGRIDLDLDGRSGGVYVLRVKTGADVVTRTILLSR